MKPPILFCNIGWMNRYEGLKGLPDEIIGGGSFVRYKKNGQEVCNFVKCEDGHVYGHVETIQGEKDRRIKIERLGGSGESIDGVDIVWTATRPGQGGRRVVGWYRNAVLFRARQMFSKPPSKQHARDEIDSYRIRALAKDVVLLDPTQRTLSLGRGKGWMGQTPWWSPDIDCAEDVRAFMHKVRKRLDGDAGNFSGTVRNTGSRPASGKSPGASTDFYRRYVETYEIVISPKHNDLQKAFEHHLRTNGATDIRPDVNSVDLRYTDSEKGLVLIEIKPCDATNTRYAIRTAMGQLLDYQQREKRGASLLIVLGAKPSIEDRELATSNGFGVAYPDKKTFKIHWPA